VGNLFLWRKISKIGGGEGGGGGGGGGGGVPIGHPCPGEVHLKKLGTGVRPSSHESYPIYDQTLQ